MADISKITIPNGRTYNIKDRVARSGIRTLLDRCEQITVGARVDGVVGDAIVGKNFVGLASVLISDPSKNGNIVVTYE